MGDTHAVDSADEARSPGCGPPPRRVDIVSPLRSGAVRVVVENQPVAPPAPVASETHFVNDCQPIPRLGQETRLAWIARIERYIEGRAHHLASVTYPPGDGVDIALVCFSSPR